MVFDIPDEIDEFLTLMFLAIFVLSFMLNTHVCGRAVIDFYNESFDVSPKVIQNDPLSSYSLDNSFSYYIQQSSNQYLKNTKVSFWSMIVIYWGIIPILCFYYAFFRFKSTMWKDLNTLTSSNLNRGVM